MQRENRDLSEKAAQNLKEVVPGADIKTEYQALSLLPPVLLLHIAKFLGINQKLRRSNVTIQEINSSLQDLNRFLLVNKTFSKILQETLNSSGYESVETPDLKSISYPRELGETGSGYHLYALSGQLEEENFSNTFLLHALLGPNTCTLPHQLEQKNETYDISASLNKDEINQHILSDSTDVLTTERVYDLSDQLIETTAHKKIIFRFIKFATDEDKRFTPIKRNMAFHYALLRIANSGNLCLLPLLLKYPFLNINFRCYYEKASRKCNSKGVQRNKVRHKYIDGVTALHLASLKGHTKVVEILLSQKLIDPNIADGWGATALSLAIANGHAEIVKLLLAHPSINVNGGNRRAEALKHILSIYELLPLSERTKTALQIYLADPRVIFNNRGLSKHQLEFYNEIKSLAKFSEKPVYPEGHINGIDEQGQTPLIAAVKKESVETVKQLLGNPEINVNQPDIQGNTALTHAIGIPQIAPLLLRHPQTDPNCFSHQGETPLLAIVGMVTRTNLLLKHPAIKLHLCTPDGENALTKAVNKGSVEFVLQLLAKGVDANQESSPNAYTPLFWAIYYGHLEIVKLLISHLSHPYHLNSVNQTALAFAKERLQLAQERKKSPEVQKKLAAIVDVVSTGESKLATRAQNQFNIYALNLKKEFQIKATGEKMALS